MKVTEVTVVNVVVTVEVGVVTCVDVGVVTVVVVGVVVPVVTGVAMTVAVGVIVCVEIGVVTVVAVGVAVVITVVWVCIQVQNVAMTAPACASKLFQAPDLASAVIVACAEVVTVFVEGFGNEETETETDDRDVAGFVIVVLGLAGLVVVALSLVVLCDVEKDDFTIVELAVGDVHVEFSEIGQELEGTGAALGPVLNCLLLSVLMVVKVVVVVVLAVSVYIRVLVSVSTVAVTILVATVTTVVIADAVILALC